VRAKSVSTPSQEELQELSGFPDEIRQCDLTQIVRLRYRLRLVKEELVSLEEQIRAQMTLGCPVEAGPLTVDTNYRALTISPAKKDE
jgi:hypothetical protein